MQKSFKVDSINPYSDQKQSMVNSSINVQDQTAAQTNEFTHHSNTTHNSAQSEAFANKVQNVSNPIQYEEIMQNPDEQQLVSMKQDDSSTIYKTAKKKKVVKKQAKVEFLTF